MNQTNIKIGQLRDRMKELGIDAYLVPTADFHESEYVGEFFKCRHFLTGFNGTAGTAVITMDKAGLWTDGRYFVQAEEQLSGSEIKLYRMGEPEFPTLDEFLEEELTVATYADKMRTFSNSKTRKPQKLFIRLTVYLFFLSARQQVLV